MKHTVLLIALFSTASIRAMEEKHLKESETINLPKRLSTISHLLCQRNARENTQFLQNLQTDLHSTVNAMDTELAVYCLLPQELQHKIMQEVNTKNVFIAKLLKEIKKPHNIIKTSFHAIAGLRAAIVYKDQIITSGAYLDNVIEIQNRISGKRTASLYGHTNWVRTMTRSGDTLFTGDDNGVIKIWHLPSKTCIKTLRAHTNFVKQIAINGTIMASASFDTNVKIWDLQTGACLHTLTKHNDVLHTVAITEGKLISGGDDCIRVWNSKNGDCIHVFPESSWYLAVIDDNTFLSASYDSFTIHTLNPPTSQPIKTYYGGARSITFVPKNLIITGSTTGILCVYEYPSLHLLATVDAHENSILSITNQENNIVTVSLDDHVKTWDISTLQHLTELKKFLTSKTTFLESFVLHTLSTLLINKLPLSLSPFEADIINTLKKAITAQFGPLVAILIEESTQPLVK